MAVVLGNVALLLDVISHRIVISDRKTRPTVVDVILNLPKRSSSHSHHHHASLSFEVDDKDIRTRKKTKTKSNSKSNDVDFDFDFGSGDDDGNEEEEEEEEDIDMYVWEKEMRKRMKELEEMKELERKAEELRSQIDEEDGDGDGDGGGEETDEEKRRRVRKELEKVAKEQAEQRETANLMYQVGQKAYGKGMYGRSIEFFEGALTIIPKSTLFGGEIQIWLAMAYEANKRHVDCIDLYQELENKHPSVGIRRQASELRYILQAPKLKISREEMVTIPLIGSSYDSYAGTWSDKYRDVDQSRTGSRTNQITASKDYAGDFLVWRPPVGLEKNRVFWVFVTLWLGLVGTAVFLQR